MTEQEVRALLAIAVSYDNRKPSLANITAWWEQADRNRWTFDEAREAIHAHHATSKEFLMPVHITAHIRSKRQLPGVFAPALEAAPAPPPERISSIVAELSRRLGWTRKSVQTLHDPALSVECPYCHAAVGRPCARLVTRGPHRGEHVPNGKSHPSRIELADGLDEKGTTDEP